jgi:hypothetical protein
MLTIRLEGPFGRWSKSVAASSCFRAVGSSIRMGTSDREVAVYRAGRWHRSMSSGTLLCLTGPFVAVTIDSKTSVMLEDPLHGERLDLGEFSQVRIDNDELHVQNRGDHVVARLDEQAGGWQSSLDDRCWPVVVFEESAACPKTVSARANGANGNRPR